MQTDDSLHTLGVAQARRGEHKAALETLRRAATAAEEAGDREYSGQIFLTIIEELKQFLTNDQLKDFYAEADQRLGEDVSRDTLQRLRTCARSVAGTTPPMTTAAAGTLRIAFAEEVRKCESALIKRALEEANGSVTRAAKTLGLTHQGLCYIINHRHKSLLSARAPIRVRRKSLIKKKQ
jgi:transcriptional regulator with GAF, ATPase, and Fis domain